MRKSLLFAAWLSTSLLARSAAAQIDVRIQPPGPLKLRYGLRVGGLATRTTTPPVFVYESDRPFLRGLQAGVAAEAAFGWLAVQPALVYSQKGHRYEGNSTAAYQGTTYTLRHRDQLRINYLELPVNFVATLHHVQLLAGPYAAWALSGYTRHRVAPDGPPPPHLTGAVYDLREDLHFGRGNELNVGYYRRFDAGLNLGVGGRLGPLQAQLTYSYGLTDFDYPAPNPNNRNPYSGYVGNYDNKHRGWQLHATYFFGGE